MPARDHRAEISRAGLPQVVLGCTACQRTWAPDMAVPVAGWQTCCPGCGGWTWLVELADPVVEPAAAVGVGGGRR